MSNEMRPPSADGIGPGGTHGGDSNDSTEPYEAPRITRLGTVAELTLGHPEAHKTDGTFPGSVF
jgi:hypothetical protein